MLILFPTIKNVKKDGRAKLIYLFCVILSPHNHRNLKISNASIKSYRKILTGITRILGVLDAQRSKNST